MDVPIARQGDNLVRVSDLDDATFEMVGKNAAVIMKQAISHFKTTGEWPGVLVFRCKTCSHRLDIWQYDEELCPYCGCRMKD